MLNYQRVWDFCGCAFVGTFSSPEDTAFQRTLDELLLRLAQKGSPALWPLISLRNGATVPKLPGDEGMDEKMDSMSRFGWWRSETW